MTGKSLIVGLLVAVVGGGLLLAFVLWFRDDSNPAAIVQAHKYMMDHVRSPSTTAFSETTTQLLEGSGNYWRVSGTMTSKAASGKTIESRYEVGMRQECDDDRSMGCWRLVKVKIDQFVVFSAK